MEGLDFSQITIQQLITHRIGNKMKEEPLLLASEETITDPETEGLLLNYFLQPMKGEDMYAFTHSAELNMNEVYAFVTRLFGASENFIDTSQHIARLLFDCTTHPKIKSGDLNIVLFKDIIFEDEILDAVGLFKSESHSPFIKMDHSGTHFRINHDYGFEAKKVDKGCLILNTDKKDGYRMYIVDTINPSSDAVYWKDEFLQAKAVENEYYQTQQFLSLAKNYVTEEYATTFEVSKADQIDLLNRSVDFFKQHDTFDQQNFETSVLQDSEIIDSFRKFDTSYSTENGIERADQFDISSAAVKKQARFFKSVLKLDKNFHIYIHGDKDMIERGVDEDGRKYYKLYYDVEQ